MFFQQWLFNSLNNHSENMLTSVGKYLCHTFKENFLLKRMQKQGSKYRSMISMLNKIFPKHFTVLETQPQNLSYFCHCLKDILKAFDDFKNMQKSVWSNVFWFVKVCMFWKCIQYTIHWGKTQMLNIFPSDKLNGTKYALFFLSRTPAHHSFTFNLRLLYELKYK